MHIRSALTKQKMNENKLKMTRSICQTIRFECTFSIFGWHFCLAAETLVKILSTKYLFFLFLFLALGVVCIESGIDCGSVPLMLLTVLIDSCQILRPSMMQRYERCSGLIEC